MMNFGALNLFDSRIKKLKNALVCINHVIYTCVLACLHSFKECHHLHIPLELLPNIKESHDLKYIKR